MIFPFIRRTAIFLCFIAIAFTSLSQTAGSSEEGPGDKASTIKAESKPFKILTSGRRITIQATQDLTRVMAWTAAGHRIVEQTTFEQQEYSFNLPVTEKIVFLMIRLKNGKYYTERIGVR